MPAYDVAKFNAAVKTENAKALREMAKPIHNQRVALAEAAGDREFTAEESARDAALKADHDACIGAAQEIERGFSRLGNPLNGAPVGNDALPGADNAGASTPTGSAFRNEAGMLIRAYKPGERLAGEGIPGEIGNTVRDIWGDKRIANSAAYGGDDESGGYLLRPAQSGRLIDLARAASVVSRAGAQTVSMTERDMHLLTVESDPSAHWRAETVAVPASSPTFGRITLRSKTLAAIVPISLEMAEDTSNGGQVIEQLLATALAAELDRAALVGSGAGAEPRGIVNAAGVNTLTSVGTPSDWSDISGGVKSIYEANYAGDPASLGLVYHPSVAAVYDGLVDSVNGQPLMPTPWAAAVRKFMTTKIPSGNMVLGDFSEVLIGVRQNVRIRVLQSGSATDSSGTTWNAADQLMFLIVAHLRADVAVMRPPFFTVASGVTTA